MMTLEEQKLAVCEKLPELVDTVPYWPHPMWMCKGGYLRQTIRWPTEGLQVCHEAEKLLMSMTGKGYPEIWQRYCKELDSHCTSGANRSATYEQRLLALCRVWWPERFV